MKQWIQNKHMQLYFAFMALQNMAANFAHPITPTLIKELQLPDYSFGLFFAGMSFTSFLFSPFWAKMIERLGTRVVLGICCVGYGLGQLMFGLVNTLPLIMIARLLAGFFVGGISCGFLSYIIHKASLENRGTYLALSATFASVFAAFGYLVGGLIGVVSIAWTFYIQTFILVVTGLGFYLVLKQDKQEDCPPLKIWKDANPLNAFWEARHFMTLAFAVLFFVVFLTSTASTAYDQCFNYFIKDQFLFDSAYNGMIKAVVGFISLFANTTICVWILRRKDVNKATIYILLIGSILLFMMTWIIDVIPFIIINLGFFAINAIYIPLLQDMCTKRGDHENTNRIIGFYNAMKSLGMIVGGLFAGFIYGYGANLSFLYAGIFFVISMFGCILYYRMNKH